jgi:hypothetical protein
MTDTPETERSEGDEPSGEEREQIAQEGRLQQTEEEEAQEGN